MEKTVLQTLSKHKMLEGVHTLSVAVSGGADSMALLHLLSRFSSEWGVKLIAVHFNHEIRGEEADADEAFVKKTCAEWGIPFISGREDVPDFAKSHKMSMETAARELRYRFLDTLSCDAIATAHTLSDHFETVLLNLTRGSGLKGLCGIPPVRGRYIRPMLDCTRTQIEGYCRDYAISYVTDKTNLSDEYARNRIRHHAVPVLKQINPAVEQAVRRLSVSLSEDEQFLSRAAGEALDRCRRESGLSVLQLSGFHPAVAKRVIKCYFEESVPGITLDCFHLEAVYSLCQKSGRTSLPSGVSAVSAGGFLYPEIPGSHSSYTVTMESVSDFFSGKEQKVHNLLLKNSLDCDKIVGNLVLRKRLPGDTIRISGTNGTKTLKKLFNEFHIPVPERADLPVIADQNGVVWIHTIGVASRCSVAKNTKQAVIIHVSTAKDSMD